MAWQRLVAGGEVWGEAELSRGLARERLGSGLAEAREWLGQRLGRGLAEAEAWARGLAEGRLGRGLAEVWQRLGRG